MAKKEGYDNTVLPLKQSARTTQSDTQQSDEISSFKMEDLFEDISQTSQDASPSAQELLSPDTNGKDIRASLGKLLNNTAENQAVTNQAPAPGSSRSVPEPDVDDKPVVEIIDEDKKAAIRKRSAKKVTPAAPTGDAMETEYDEKIISVDQITDLTGLILPKGTKFKIEDLNLHGRINAFESTGTGTLPQEFNEIWKREFSDAGFKDLDIDGEIEIEKQKLKAG